MAKKYKPKKARNWLAIRAFQRNGAGNHGDKRKQANKKACRNKIKDYS